ncbi:MAG: dihydroneopterin aldolase [Paludibacteraceae bacterium]|nr:dihydroneopterin aldolase [Paludibacteraceae bacterium]
MEILVEGIELWGYHGVYEEENRIGGKYTVDVRLKVADNFGEDDRIESTVNYETVYGIVRQEMEKRSKLIEDVARRIAKEIKAMKGVEGAEVAVYKYNPAMGGKVWRTGVKIEI